MKSKMIVIGKSDSSCPSAVENTVEMGYNELDPRLWRVSAEEFYGGQYADVDEDFYSSNFNNDRSDDVEQVEQKEQKMLASCNTFVEQMPKEQVSTK